MNNTKYNATVIGKIMMTPDLMILRVRTDEPRDQFKAGQYTTIGVLAAEQRSTNSAMSLEHIPNDVMITRPYSIASANTQTRDFEFYISQVKSGQLTPRLFNLAQGSRMWVDDRILGIFHLNETPSDCNIVMIATGTGLAPYISFLRSHINENKNIKMAVIHGAANVWDLGYYSELSFINSTFDNFYYFPTLLKPDSSWNGLEGYIETHLKSGLLESSGIEINPDKTHFYMCGNPKMVESVSEYLSKYKYTRHCSQAIGALHVEEY